VPKNCNLISREWSKISCLGHDAYTGSGLKIDHLADVWPISRLPDGLWPDYLNLFIS
jgi:hypothetical protein